LSDDVLSHQGVGNRDGDSLSIGDSGSLQDAHTCSVTDDDIDSQGFSLPRQMRIPFDHHEGGVVLD
jgi:hypothetical protein